MLSSSNVVRRRCMYSDKHFVEVSAYISGKKKINIKTLAMNVLTSFSSSSPLFTSDSALGFTSASLLHKVSQLNLCKIVFITYEFGVKILLFISSFSHVDFSELQWSYDLMYCIIYIFIFFNKDSSISGQASEGLLWKRHFSLDVPFNEKVLSPLKSMQHAKDTKLLWFSFSFCACSCYLADGVITILPLCGVGFYCCFFFLVGWFFKKLVI